VNLSPDDAMELGQLLQFLDDWLATDREQLGASLARFIGSDGYGPGTLRNDLARFMFLLGVTDGEGLFFSPRAAELSRTHRASGPGGPKRREFSVRNLQSG
jgi:hypothetical protein